MSYKKIFFNNILKMETVAIKVCKDDNIAVAKKMIKKGSVVRDGRNQLKFSADCPKGARFAVIDIPSGAPVVQYNSCFAVSKGIGKGEIIESGNTRENRTSFEKIKEKYRKPGIRFKSGKKEILHKPQGSKYFKGILRKDGRVGTRNYFAVVPTSLCASDIALKLAGEFDKPSVLRKFPHIDGVVAASHTEGCGCNDGCIVERVMLTLKNTINHPNVGGAIIIDLGCEKTNYNIFKKYMGDISSIKKPVDFLTIQKSGGTGGSLEKGRRLISKRLAAVDRIKRNDFSIDKLLIGTECGASDTFSGITANPLIGNVVDKVISYGGSSILSEFPEMIGAEEILIDRMSGKSIVKKFIKEMEYYRNLARLLGIEMEGNLVSGNIEGGIINLTLKSLGAILKGGSTAIVDSVQYAEAVKRKGLNIMNGPGNDFESMTGLAASGANLMLFSTGRGTTEGNLIVPVIKISSTTELFNKMSEDIDFDAGRLLDRPVNLDELGDELLDYLIKVASGEKTWSEKWKKRSFQIWSAGKLPL